MFPIIWTGPADLAERYPLRGGMSTGPIVAEPFDALDNYAIRPIHYLSPQQRPCVVSLGIDWHTELQWLRELAAECDALDAWENEGGR
jgi:hypothetical protein